jgi:hypothetical protein
MYFKETSAGVQVLYMPQPLIKKHVEMLSISAQRPLEIRGRRTVSFRGTDPVSSWEIGPVAIRL